MRTDNNTGIRRFPEAVLFDRDGTLIEDAHYLSSPEQVVLLPGVAQSLARLMSAGARLFMVSNQSGVGRGYFDREAVYACNARLAELLAEYSVRFMEMLFCPHDPKERCACRKPEIGMWEELRGRYGLRAESAVVIGDKLDDVRFGHACGLAASVLVLTGKGEETARGSGLPRPTSGFQVFAAPASDFPHAVARDMEAAADFLFQGVRRAIT